MNRALGDHGDIESPDGALRVYLRDATAMPELADATVDLIVTSPPYGIGLDYSSGTGVDTRESPPQNPGQVEGPVKSMDDYRAYVARLAPIWRECWRVLRPGGFATINVAPIHTKAEYFGHSFMLPLTQDLAAAWMAMGAEFRWKYVWVAGRTRNNSKGQPQTFLGSYPLPLRGQVLRMIEEILVFWKPADPWEIEPEREARRRESKMSIAEWRDSFSQVWEFPGEASKPDKTGVKHPASFPEELPRRLIRGYSCRGDLVLDPFLGTGTTMRVAREMGRRCVGYEIEARYRNMIETRTAIRVPGLEAFG